MATGAKAQIFDLKQVKKGSTVVVTLRGNAANVQLLDSTGYSAYKNGRNHRYIGGLVKRSPTRLVVPRTGHWYVAVDMNGLRGTTRATVQVEPPALPTYRPPQQASLSVIRHELPPAAVRQDAEIYDVFISHASEDKDAVARPLAESLESRGVKVWLDESVLRIGDSLRRRIDAGLARSRFGVVVISRSFLEKGWTNYELDGLVSRSVSGEQTLLPIWHEITKDEVQRFSPSLVNKIARSTAQFTVEEIAEEIAEVVGLDQSEV